MHTLYRWKYFKWQSFKYDSFCDRHPPNTFVHICATVSAVNVEEILRASTLWKYTQQYPIQRVQHSVCFSSEKYFYSQSIELCLREFFVHMRIACEKIHSLSPFLAQADLVNLNATHTSARTTRTPLHRIKSKTKIMVQSPSHRH